MQTFLMATLPHHVIPLLLLLLILLLAPSVRCLSLPSTVSGSPASAERSDHRLRPRSLLEPVEYTVERRLVNMGDLMMEIREDGSIRGTLDRSSSDGLLKVTYTTITTILSLLNHNSNENRDFVQIKSSAHKLWLCLNSNGTLYTKTHGKGDPECKFKKQTLPNKRETLYSEIYPPPADSGKERHYYVALHKRTGRPRSAIDRPRQSAQFLIIQPTRKPSPSQLPEFLLELGSDSSEVSDFSVRDSEPSTNSRRQYSRPENTRRQYSRKSPTNRRLRPGKKVSSSNKPDALLSSLELTLKSLGTKAPSIKYKSGLELPDPTFNLVDSLSIVHTAVRHKARKSEQRLDGRQYQRAPNE